jgi:iron(III) transport system permease protein
MPRFRKPGGLVPRAFFIVCLVLLFAPLACALREAFRAPGSWRIGFELDRLAILAGNSLALALLAMAIAVPVGGWLGLVLERGELRGRGALRFALLATLFVPLAVQAVAWQVVLGSWLPPLSGGPGTIAWRPWNEGLLPAAWVHAWAAVPWVAAIAMAGLRTADPALEDQAKLDGGPRFVLRRVLAPRLALALAAGGGWIAAQTATEIAVTDTMMVRTFAEETYARIVGDPAGVGAAVAATVPVWLLAGCGASLLARRLERRFGPPESTASERRDLPLSGAALAFPLVGLVVLVPLAALVWKAGLSGSGWSLANLVSQLRRTVLVSGTTYPANLLAAFATGLATAWLAARLCWRLRDRPGTIVAGAVVLAFAPAPVVGLGLKECIDLLLGFEEWVFAGIGWTPGFPPLRSLLYDQPSPLPGMWASAIRYFPVAVAILLPAIRGIPKELFELAALDGVDPWKAVGRPLVDGATGLAAAAVAALSLGEVGAGKLVVPPQWPVAAQDLFNQMHYGTEAGVAAMALVQAGLALVPFVPLYLPIGPGRLAAGGCVPPAG